MNPFKQTNFWLDKIREERIRQIDIEGWDRAHDDEHDRGQLANAAAYYAASNPSSTYDGAYFLKKTSDGGIIRSIWPFNKGWNKKRKHNRVKQLVIAGALIVAELERLERKELREQSLPKFKTDGLTEVDTWKCFTCDQDFKPGGMVYRTQDNKFHCDKCVNDPLVELRNSSGRPIKDNPQA